MPIYEYKCQECDHVFEDMVLSSKDSGPDKCPKCGAPNVSRLISGTNFQLKGGGWFHSDYGKKGSAPASDAPAATKDSGEKSVPSDTAVASAPASETKAAPSESAKAAPAPSESKPSV